MTLSQANIEERVHSQYGEDGIIRYLLDCIPFMTRNHVFLDIGAGNGVKRSNVFNLAKQGDVGILIEANRRRSADSVQNFRKHFGGDRQAIEHVNLAVTAKLVAERRVPHIRDGWMPDFISIDIDSDDWGVAQALLRRGVFGTIWCVEYNPNFGPELSLRWNPEDRRHRRSRWRNLYYGASLHAWVRLFRHFGYEFVCVESHGSNAFFINPHLMDLARVGSIEWIKWADNAGWHEQFGPIPDRLRQIRSLGYRPIKVFEDCA